MRWFTIPALLLMCCGFCGTSPSAYADGRQLVTEYWHQRETRITTGEQVLISKQGVARIAKHEGLRLQSYQDMAGIWTIGYGHTGTLLDGQTKVGPNQTITSDEALALFAKDLKWVEVALNKFAAKAKLVQHEFDALASLVFNTGAGVLDATRSLGLAVRTGNRRAIGAAMLLYKNATVGGVKKPVLLGRRVEERDLFLRGYPIGVV